MSGDCLEWPAALSPWRDLRKNIRQAEMRGAGRQHEKGTRKQLGGRTFLRSAADAASGRSDLRDRSEAARRDLEPRLRTADRRCGVRGARHVPALAGLLREAALLP